MDAPAHDHRTGPPPAPYRLLDAWRGVAVLWVVMIHACLPTVANESPALARRPLYAFSLWGQLGVVMFFVISGYCITAAVDSALRKPRPVAHFLCARLRRIYPPYFLSAVLAVLFSLLLSALAARRLIPPIHHPTPFLGQPVLFYVAALTLTQVPLHQPPILSVYWSLSYEVTFYALVALCLGLLGGRSRIAFHTGLNLLTLGSLAWLVVSPSACPFPLTLWYQFGLGAFVFQLLTGPPDGRTRIGFGAAVVLALLFAWFHPGVSQLGHPSSRVQTVFCLLFALVLLGLFRLDAALSRLRAVRVLEWLGTISYSLYLTHFFVIPVPQQIAKRLGFRDDSYWVSFLAQIAAALAFATVFHLLAERPFLSSRAKTREARVTLSEPPEGDPAQPRETAAEPSH